MYAMVEMQNYIILAWGNLFRNWFQLFKHLEETLVTSAIRSEDIKDKNIEKVVQTTNK